jgi:hypothetical protein
VIAGGAHGRVADSRRRLLLRRIGRAGHAGTPLADKPGRLPRMADEDMEGRRESPKRSAMIGASIVEAQKSAYDPIGQRRDFVDVARVHEDDATVDVETGETEFLGQADVEDGQITVQVGIFVDDQIEVPVLEQ